MALSLNERFRCLFFEKISGKHSHESVLLKVLEVAENILTVPLRNHAVQFLSVLTFGTSSFRYLAILLSILGVLRTVRAILRVNSVEFWEFIEIVKRLKLTGPVKDYLSDRKDPLLKSLKNYNITRGNWPRPYVCSLENDSKNIQTPKIEYYLLGVFANWLAVPIVYPGATTICDLVISWYCSHIRKTKQEKFFPCHIKITSDLIIDTIFFDSRIYDPSSKKLIITCEGNFSFYENGIFCRVVDGCEDASYLGREVSVLGWNYPGYLKSKGVPFYFNIEKCIHALMDYAIKYLGFKMQDIILLGWSIGGYPVSFAANKYPEIGGIIIDASFDSVIKIAKNTVPITLFKLDKIMEHCFSNYLNLNSIKMLTSYKGKVKFIVRSKDEIMKLNSDPLSNLSLHLAMEYLSSRYPEYFNVETINVLWIAIKDQMSVGWRSKSLQIPFDADFSNPKIRDAFLKFNKHVTIKNKGHNESIDYNSHIQEILGDNQ